MTGSSSTIAAEELPNHCIFASDVYCIVLVASLFDCVSGLAYGSLYAMLLQNRSWMGAVLRA